MYQVKVDDSQVMDFVRKSPKRARWANSEALKMTGGHLRKEIRAFIQRGGRGWRPLHPVSEYGRRERRGPLAGLAKLVRFKYGTSKGTQNVMVGFFPVRETRFLKRKRKTVTKRTVRQVRARFRQQFGMTHEALARIHEYGKRRRVTPAMRRKLAAMGQPIQKKTRVLETPARPMIGPVFEKNRNAIPRYHEKRFFQKFFSKEKPMLRI